jgi:hypothetical protein
MKDIDLLPEWYKSGQRKQHNLRSQYLVVAGVVAIILVWNFAAVHSLSTARARLDNTMPNSVHAQAVLEHCRQLADRIDKLSKKTALLDAIDSKINIANVLSELSFLVDARIALSDVIIESEKFPKGSGAGSGASGVRVATSSGKRNADEHLGAVRFKVTLRGIADQTSDVGKFVRRLEESEYFSDVSLAFSRNKNIRVTGAQNGDQRQVSEFEISCNLANYRIEQGR